MLIKKSGKINQPGDLDIASFNAVSGDVVNITMRDVDVDMIPVLEFYRPDGSLIVHTTDVFETAAVISNYYLNFARFACKIQVL